MERRYDAREYENEERGSRRSRRGLLLAILGLSVVAVLAVLTIGLATLVPTETDPLAQSTQDLPEVASAPSEARILQCNRRAALEAEAAGDIGSSAPIDALAPSGLSEENRRSAVARSVYRDCMGMRTAS
jgi:hypothetical protein